MSQFTIIQKYGHTSDKTGSPGFHGKYNRKTQKHEPEKRAYKYIPIVLGFALRNDPPYINDKSNVSYAKIGNQTVVRTGAGENTISHKVEIKDNRVYLNDILIAKAPAGKSKAQKEKFCKAIVWSFLNDPISLTDKLSEIAGNVDQDKPVIQETIDEEWPDADTVIELTITNEEITGYPKFKHTIGDELTDQERCDLIAMSYDDIENHEYDNVSLEFHDLEIIKEMWSQIDQEKPKTKLPVFPAGFIPYLNLTITEEVCA